MTGQGITASGAARATVSVITINRENARGLERTIASVRAQVDAEYEWILIDGDSTDGSVELARAWTDGSNVTIVSEPDAGIYDAMNKGLARASGDLVVYLNSGDQLTHSHVLASAVRRLSRDDAVWGYGAQRYMSHDGTPLSATVFAPFRLPLLALGLRTIPHQAAYLPRTLLQELGGFRTDFGIAADQELLYRAALESTPEAWIEFMADFEPGGQGSERPPSAFPLDMRRARALAHQPLGNALVDSAATAASVAAQCTLVWQTRARRRLRRAR